jgi:hypothetical protein
MKPYRSNTEKENCSPVSSNCVTWQGPDISCINLCKGDSVSDIVYKLATQLCEIEASTNISDLELTEILNFCYDSPQPEMTIAAVLQLIIDKTVCSVNDLSVTTSDLTAKTDNLYEEPNLPLPSCLQYIDPETGLPVTELILSQYVITLAAEICSIKSNLDETIDAVSNHETRIVALETKPGYMPPTVMAPCSLDLVPANYPVEMNVLLESLSTEFCTLVGVLGSNTNLNNASAQQCPNLGSQAALSQPGTLSSLPGWNNTISNFAQSIQNLWITVCDMRTAVYDVKACCGQADCSAFFLIYQATTDTARENVTLIFNSGTVIPSGFSNCPLLTSVSITDGNGHTYTDIIDLVSLATDPSGITLPVSDASLDPLLTYTVTVSGCIVKDGVTCSKVVPATLVAPPVTPSCSCYTWSVNIDAGDISAAGGNTLPTRDNKVFVDYYDCNATTITTASYTSAGADSLGCSCLIPSIYYYKDDVKTPADQGSVLVLDGVCAP